MFWKKDKKFSSSGIRVRLTSLFLALYGTMLLIFCFALYRDWVKNQDLVFNSALRNFAIDIAEEMAISRFHKNILLDDSPEALLETQGFPFPLGRAFVEIRNAKGKVLARSKNLEKSHLPWRDFDKQLYRSGSVVFDSLDSSILPDSRSAFAQFYRVITYFPKLPSGQIRVIQVAVPLTILEKQRTQMILFLIVALAVLLAVATIGSLIVANQALSPLSELISKTRSIHPHQLSERILIPQTQDEIQELATTLNSLLERLDHAFQSQERFVADASHQLKTPLSILRGELELVQNHLSDPQAVRDFISSASQEIDHLTRLVENLLLLAQVDSQKAALSVSKVSLDELVCEAIARLEPLTRKRSIKMAFNIEENPEGDFDFEGDKNLLQSMITNIIENAAKYSKEGSTVRIFLSTKTNHLSLDVADEGPGISSDDKPRLFERFYRNPSLAKGTEGTGLGLSIARKIAILHNGSLSLLKSVPSGSIFRIELART